MNFPVIIPGKCPKGKIIMWLLCVDRTLPPSTESILYVLLMGFLCQVLSFLRLPTDASASTITI